MIGHLEGKLRHKSPDFIILDVHGVGYMVQVPLSTFCDLPESGQSVSLHIHTHVREDVIQLYGFRTAAEREMFLILTTVNGVGPRLAVNILSGVGPDEIRKIVLQQNAARLRSIPGVGKKIAERIMLELRDKLKGKETGEEAAAPLSVGTDVYSDAFSALMNLGYRSAEAEKALNKARQQFGDDVPLEKLLKESFRFLG